MHSVQSQTYPCKHLVVVDGKKYFDEAEKQINKTAAKLPEIVRLKTNVGSDGWYGHRIYAAFSFLVNEDYIIYLDEDNWLESNHVETLMNTIYLKGKVWADWAFSYRNIYDKDGEYICPDTFESRGIYHIDTSCFCIPKEIAVKIGHSWYGKWGADRQFFTNLKFYYPKFYSSQMYTLNYRLGGNPGSPTKEFFLEGSARVKSNGQN